MKYIIGIDQSTQGTKAVLFDQTGQRIARADKPHRQLINEKGWISHDPEEIYQNVLETVERVIGQAKVPPGDIEAVGISNQRETTVMWDAEGVPCQNAVIWQCARAAQITERMSAETEKIYDRTGLPLSPYFPAAKMAWLLENGSVSAKKGIHLGTVDSWLVYKLTGGTNFKTDYSNASRTQLFNIHTLQWDEELCRLFGVDRRMLPEVCDSNSCFGETDFDGILERKIPIHAVLGDSHGALFGQGCYDKGMIKATYGTGSSVMMNTGSQCVRSRCGLATSLAWGMDGRVTYVLEGNINYTGAVVSWLKEDVKLIASAQETEELAAQANPEDETVLIPAFSGLSAPYWINDAKAVLTGMSRTTGRAEIVKAALDSIVFQIADVVEAMERECGIKVRTLRTDGGPTKNAWLMQRQSDVCGCTVQTAEREELSATGAAYMAGLAAGLCDRQTLAECISYRTYVPVEDDGCEKSRARWKKAIAGMTGGGITE